MRNIGFDESSVMGELMKIAHDKNLLGLKKEAEGPRDLPQAQEPVSQDPGRIQSPVDKFATALMDMGLAEMIKYYKGQKVDANKIVNELKEFLSSGRTFLNLGPNEYKKYIDLVKKLKRQFAPLLTRHYRMLNKKYPGQETTKRFEELLMMLRNAKTSSKKQENVKTADEHYEVTKGTGKEIIDEAHPGGGTKTELSHSKTDENLVETIFEAHEKHLEVANKKPTGVYAALADLYLGLSKMGHKEKLGGLKKLIKVVATNEAVIEHTLVRLADNLDASGHTKAADAVDSLLKKKIAQDTVNLLEGTPFDPNHKGKSVHDFPEDTITVDKEKVKRKRARSEAVKLFQKRYNRLLGLRPGDPKYLKEDGILGPNTTKAKYDREYIAAHMEEQKNKGKETDVAHFMRSRTYRPVDAMRLFIGKFREKFPNRKINSRLRQKMSNMSQRFSQMGLDKSKEEMDKFLNNLESKLKE